MPTTTKQFSFQKQKHECYQHGVLKRGRCIRHENACEPSTCRKERVIRQLKIEGKM